MSEASKEPYVPLWIKTSASFREGATQPEEMIRRAAELGLRTVAITDRDGIYGIVRAHVEAVSLGLRVIVGAQATLHDPRVREGAKLVLVVESRDGHAALCRMLTIGHARAPKGISHVTLDEVAAVLPRGLIALVDEPDVLRALLETGSRSMFRKQVYAMITRHLEADDGLREDALRELAETNGIETVAAVEVLYDAPSRRPLADVLACVRHGVRIDEAGTRTRPNAEHALLDDASMRRLFADDLASVQRTNEVAARCRFGLAELRYRYPSERLPEGRTEHQWLRDLVFDGARTRYEGEIPDDVRKQIERELELIERLEYGGYFLTMYEIVQFCRARAILCQGRGSAANSVVCYCLGITAVDPVRMELLFERFISAERAEPPDIDLDIEHERREEVIQWLYARSGRRHVAMVANFVRFRSRSAIREVAKVLGFQTTTRDRLARLLSRHGSEIGPEAFLDAGVDPASRAAKHLIALSNQIQELPRHLSIHSGGFLLGHEPVDELVPVEPATMEGRTVIQWDKYDVEALGLFKVDLLALGCLTHIRKSLTMLRELGEAELELATIPAEDPKTYAMLSRADTVGVFQVESRAQMSMLPRLRPKTFYDLVVEVALVRPGPIQGGMIHPYLRRRLGAEPVEYPHPALKRTLSRTLGVPIFQEQVMKLAIDVAGYTGGQADQLRRDMAAWKSSGRIEAHRERLIRGLLEHGIDADYAERIYRQIQGFGEYGFPESHAASFALLAYATAWLRAHHLAAFVAGLLNSQPMGFYAPSTIIEDARHHGLVVRPVDVERSAWDWSLERLESGRGSEHRFALRAGFRDLLGFGQSEREALEGAPPPYHGLHDFVRRTRLSRKHLIALAEAGALDSFGIGRRDASWAVRGLHATRDDELELSSVTEPLFPPTTRDEEICWDYERSQLSTRGHPMQSIRESIEQRGFPHSKQIRAMPDGTRTAYIGLVICRQRPATSKGVTFFTLEDEHGFVNLVVWRNVFATYSVLATTASLVGVSGRIQNHEGVVHLVVESFFDCDERLGIRRASRDFH